MGNRVERVLTPVSETEMTSGIISAWQQLFGSPPAREQVALILAQNALETGHRKTMHNYNIGNITTDGKSYDYILSGDTDGKGNAITQKFRAYNSLADGLKDYIKFLSEKPRYAQAWQHILNPNPQSYSKALKDAGYYTAPESGYTRNLVSLFDKFIKSKSYDESQAAAAAAAASQASNPSQPLNPAQTGQPAQAGQPSQKAEKPEDINISHDDMYKSATEKLDDVLSGYLKNISASNKKYYKKYLPNNTFNIQVKSVSGGALSGVIAFQKFV